MISNSTSVSLVTEEKLFPMTHKTRKLFFSPFFQLEEETSTKLYQIRTKRCPKLYIKRALIHPDYIF